MEVEINLKVLLKSLLKHLWVIVLVTLLVTLLVAVYTVSFVTPVYRATTTACVLVTDRSGTTGSNLTTTINLMGTYAISVQSDNTMQVASDLIEDESYTPEAIRSMVEVTYEEGDIILYISAVSSNPNNAAILANTVAQAAAHSIDLAELTVLNKAVPPTSPYSPSLFVNLFIAAFLSFFATYAIFLLIDLNNNKVVSEEQLAEILEVPVVGVVPFVDSMGTAKKSVSGGEKNEN